MPVHFDNQKERWRFRFRRKIDGRLFRRSKLLPKGWNRAQAEKYDRWKSAALYAQASGLEQPSPLIDQAVALYLEHKVPDLRNGRKSGQELAQLITYFAGRTFDELASIAREYRKDRKDLAPATVKNRLSYLRAACRYAWKKHNLGDRKAPPGLDMEMPVVRNQRDVQLPVDQIAKLLGKIDDVEARAVFTLAFRVGSRWRKNVWPRQPADVERVGNDTWLRVGITKNGTPRMKWVHPDARWALKFLPFKMSSEYYYDRFCEARAAVGLDQLPGNLERLWVHDMRHVIATDILKRGGSLGDVGAALDHDSHQASARYAHITSPHVKRVLSGVGKGIKLPTGRRQRQPAAVKKRKVNA